MTIHITPEIEAAFEAHLNEEVDWDFLGQKILRRETTPFFDNPRHGFLEFAAGWQASRQQALEEAFDVCKQVANKYDARGWDASGPAHCGVLIRSLTTTGEKE